MDFSFSQSSLRELLSQGTAVSWGIAPETVSSRP